MDYDRELADLAVTQRLLTPDELNAAVETQKLTNRPLLTVLHDLSFLTLLQIDRVRDLKKRSEEEARAAAEARRKADDEARRKAEEEARRKAEEDARRKAEEDAKRKAEEEARRKRETEARRKAEEDRKRAEEEARRRAEEEAAAAKGADIGGVQPPSDEGYEEVPAEAPAPEMATEPIEEEKPAEEIEQIPGGMGDMTMLGMGQSPFSKGKQAPAEEAPAEEAAPAEEEAPAEDRPPEPAPPPGDEPMEMPGGMGDLTMLNMGAPGSLRQAPGAKVEQAADEAPAEAAEGTEPVGRPSSARASRRARAPEAKKSGGCGKKAAMLLLAIGTILALIACR